MRVILFILATLIIIPTFGQRAKKKDDDLIVPTFVEGITYSLPQTGIRVYISATKNEFTPGPYAQYAEQFLGITNVSTTTSTFWEIENIRFESFSEPDALGVFKAMGFPNTLIGLASNGCIIGVNSNTSTNSTEKVITNPVLKKEFGGFDVNYTNYSDSPFFMAGDSTNNFRSVKVSFEQKAAEAAARILKCRTIRFETAAGFLDELPPDGEAYKQSLAQLEKIEQDYLKLFIGHSSQQSASYSFEFMPTAKGTNGEVICRFSEENGILDKSNLSGKPVMLGALKMQPLASKFEILKDSDNPNAGQSGIYYRNPGMGEINIIYDLKTIATSRMVVAQFGTLAPVPEELLDGSFSIEFYPETGAIKNIKQQ